MKDEQRQIVIIKLYIVAMGTMTKLELGGRVGRVDLRNYEVCECVYLCV